MSSFGKTFPIWKTPTPCFSVTNAQNSSFPIFFCRCLQSRAWAGSLLRLPPRFAGSAANGQRGLAGRWATVFFSPNKCWPTKILKKQPPQNTTGLSLLASFNPKNAQNDSPPVAFKTSASQPLWSPGIRFNFWWTAWRLFISACPSSVAHFPPLGPPRIQARIRNIARAYLSSRLYWKRYNGITLFSFGMIRVVLQPIYNDPLLPI